MIVFPTIRHTGSRFIVNLFGYEWSDNKSWIHNEGHPGDHYFDHIEVFEFLKPHSRRMFEVLEQNTVVIPLRHPRVVERSWQDRNLNIADLVDNFEFLANEIDPIKPHYLPLDSRYRDRFLRQINDALGLEIETDWEPVKSERGNWQLRYDEFTGSEWIEDLCERIAPFLDRFYGNCH